jgi:DNA-binding LacI/PurR family transcriptional regulator
LTPTTFYKRSQKIRALAEKMGCRPNRAAMNLRKCRHHAIGLFVETGLFNIPDRALVRILTLCRTSRLCPVIETFDPQANLMPISLIERSVDGAIMFEDMPWIEHELKAAELPTVFVNTNHPVEPNCIAYDENQGIKTGIAYLRERGRKQIAYIRPSKNRSVHYSVNMRIAGSATPH